MANIALKNSSYNYSYRLDYDQLMLRGSSLKVTPWIYGIVVYTGKDTKIEQNGNENKPQKRS